MSAPCWHHSLHLSCVPAAGIAAGSTETGADQGPSSLPSQPPTVSHSGTVLQCQCRVLDIIPIIAAPPRLAMLGAASTSASILAMPTPLSSSFPTPDACRRAVPLPPTPVSFPPTNCSTEAMDMERALSPRLSSSTRRGRCTKPSIGTQSSDILDPCVEPTGAAAAATMEIEDTLDLPLPTSSTWLSTPTTSTDCSSSPTDAANPVPAIDASSSVEPSTRRRRGKSRRAPSRLPPHPPSVPTLTSSRPAATVSVCPLDPPLSYPSTLSLTRRRLTDLPLPLLIPHPTPHAFAALHSLDLSRNRLTGLPAALSDLSNLRHLNLAHNHLTHLPRLLCAFEYLQSLVVSQNRISGPLPAWLAYLTHLRVLKVDCNQFQGAVPLAWSALTRLEVLALGSATYGGNLIDGLPEGVFAGMPALRQVDLAGNRIAHLPRDLFSECKSQLVTVNVEGNKLDTLPDSIHTAPRLAAVYAANNLMCRLPATIMQCPALEVLDLSGNALCFVPMELIVAVHRRRVTVLLTGNPFTRFHEADVESILGRAVHDAEDLGAQESTRGAQDAALDSDPMDVDGGSAPAAPYVALPGDRAYIHPDALDFNPQLPLPTAPTCTPTSQPIVLPAPGRAMTAATAAPPLVRVPISLRELAARKSLPHLARARAHLPERLLGMLEAAELGAACPRCASPVVGEFLATVEVQRVLGHALVPVRKRYCSTECLLGPETLEQAGEGKENVAPPRHRPRLECCGLGINCCRAVEAGRRGVTRDGSQDARPVRANVVRSCLW